MFRRTRRAIRQFQSLVREAEGRGTQHTLILLCLQVRHPADFGTPGIIIEIACSTQTPNWVEMR
jgi:hypothetical protein